MLNGLVLATPTYNSLEYIRVFIESWRRYAYDYDLVVVSDGSTDGTCEVLREFEDIIFIDLVRNYGQPRAYNTCMLTSKSSGASYVLMLNDDMVFGPGWDTSLEKYEEYLLDGGLLSLNLAWPGPEGYSAVSYPAGGKDPSTFDFEKWELFCDSYNDVRDFLPPANFGPGFPFILSTNVVDNHLFDETYAGGGCLDTDFLLSLWLGGYKLNRLSGNLLFHFSGGATDKQKHTGAWIEHGETFERKWGIGIGKVICAMEGKITLSNTELQNLRDRYAEYRN